MKQSFLTFIGYLIYIKNYSLDHIEQMSAFQLIIEKDDFDRWKKDPYNNYREGE